MREGHLLLRTVPLRKGCERNLYRSLPRSLSPIRVRAYVCACVSVRRFNYSPGEHDSRRLCSIETGRRGGRVGGKVRRRRRRRRGISAAAS